jgi:hypothetical protein
VEKHVETMMNATSIEELKSAFEASDKAAKAAKDSQAIRRFVAVKDSVKQRLTQPTGA